MEFRILGPIEVVDGDHRLALGGPKQRALLGLLLLHANKVVSSDRLIDELWSGEGREDAIRALQVAISRLRRALEPDRTSGSRNGAVLTRAPGYLLRVDDECLDVKRFEALLSEGLEASASGDVRLARRALDRALCLWRGPALAELTYESFAQGEIARLEELRLRALEERIAADVALGLHSDVLGELEALVAEHPLRERLRGQLMLALYRAGRQAEALATFDRGRAALVATLGIEPARELRVLHQAILEQDASLAAPAQRFPDRPDAPGSVFIGRDSELRELRRGVDRAVAGRGSLFLVAGEPGIGKSRLIDEFARHCRGRGMHVVWGRCWEGKGAPPFWPWVQLLRACLRTTEPATLLADLGPGAEQLAELLPELRERLPRPARSSVGDPEAARFRMFDAVARFVRATAQRRPLVLLFDDIHAADEPSLLLLRFLAGQLDDLPGTAVAAYRDTEAGAGREFQALLTDLAREPTLRQIYLRGFERDEVAALLHGATGRTPPVELVGEIHTHTEGNPLFVTEIVRLLESERRLDEGAGAADAADLGVPSGVRWVIGRRLEQLDEASKSVLEVAAVLGREFELDALSDILDGANGNVRHAVEQALGVRLVAPAPGGPGLRFSHALVRDALYESLPAGRRIEFHRRVGEALERRYARDPEAHLTELAFHFYEGVSRTGAAKAVHYAQAAGRRAAEQLGYEEAARLYRLALDALELSGRTDHALACELLLAQGDAQARAGSIATAKQTFLQAAAIARRGNMHERLARAALGYGGRWVWEVGRGDPYLLPLLEEAAAKLPPADSELRVRILARLAGGPLKAGEHRARRIALSRQGLEMARRLDDPAVLSYALDGRVAAILGPDTLEEQWALQAELRRLAEDAGDLERIVQGQIYRLFELMARLELDEFPSEHTIASSRADELRQPAQRWMVGSIGAMHALLTGRLDEAEALIDAAHELGRDAMPWNAAVVARLQRFVLRGLQGRLEEVEADVCSAVKEYASYPVWRAVRVSLYAGLRREAETRAALDDVAGEGFAIVQQDEEWLLSMVLIADGCAMLRDLEHSETLYQRLAPYAQRNVMAEAELALGSTGRAIANLAATLGRHDEAMRHFKHAADVNRRAGAIPWAAHALHDHARMLIARPTRGEVDELQARRLLNEARRLYRSAGMPAWAERANPHDATIPIQHYH
jgi:DNA-binding SARP family transcriptional activator/tetratricopeptide (TPR) repeat protein